MYPPVTQFETRHEMILDELRVREERRLARRSTPRIPRAKALRMRLARMLRLSASRHLSGPEPPRRYTGQSADPPNVWPFGWKA